MSNRPARLDAWIQIEWAEAFLRPIASPWVRMPRFSESRRSIVWTHDGSGSEDAHPTWGTFPDFCKPWAAKVWYLGEPDPDEPPEAWACEVWLPNAPRLHRFGARTQEEGERACDALLSARNVFLR